MSEALVATETKPTPPVIGAQGVSRAAPVARRVAGAVVGLGAASILALAAWLTPAGAGLGTHERLNLPPCQWIVLMDMPCPTCGMTTAFAHAADGHLLRSFLTQPMGFVLALSTAMAMLVGFYVAMTGSALAGTLRGVFTARAAWLLGAAFLAAWVFKVLSYRGVF